MNLNKPASESQPQSFKGHMATATVLSDRVVFKRSPLARLGGNRSGEVLLADVVAINVTDPTGWVNGHVHLQTAADAGPLRAASKEAQRTMAGNPRSIMFSWGQRETFKRFVAAVQGAWEAQRRAV
ncbi:hypothetical protein OG864_45215 [Streptomyces sp. NBC_00124]|uniref:hypothetical protein n=1 Tax=Streptomyces sp. NBC_00124 TaxID=2975662 RepID=UPI00224E8C6E|nr:hypothetical protein [Streptomyces sp. NBC_00124]MCX5365903.1 hypothetical protein [Streptomyces sp. NBC_00124]